MRSSGGGSAVTARLKPCPFKASLLGGTTEVMPCPLPLSELRSLDSRGRLSLREFFRSL